MPQSLDQLRAIKSFPSLVKFLRDQLDWPIESDDFEELTFDWDATELGIGLKDAAKIQAIKQLRPLSSRQPWGIFFIKFEPKRLPVVALRRLLSNLVVKKRATARSADKASWKLHDLLFISEFGKDDDRQITLAHFAEPPAGDQIPTLKVLGWDELDTELSLAHVDATLRQKLKWPEKADRIDQWRSQWSTAFTLRHRQVINTAKELAEKLAELAKAIRAKVQQVLEMETDDGPLQKLCTAFREALIHDLSDDDFADMYAQTITYGLFSAAVSRTTPEDGTAVLPENLTDMVPVTNPFLREMLGRFLTVGGRKSTLDFDELGIQEVVDLLNSDQTNLNAVIRNFGDRRDGEDPVIHFYEDFLKQYDKKRKVERGVFYTPQPVVSYIVRSVDELLQTEFGLDEGLASTVTWAEMLQQHAALEIPKGAKPDDPFVVILDPATGTGTFLVEVIDVIHRRMTEKWKRERLSEKQREVEWNRYVPQHLLPRLFGYELMMAPYAIAHMKIGLKLAETGYRFGTDERARIYLTNALEPCVQQPPLIGFDALAHEAAAVNAVKRDRRFTVVIGNPPYAGHSKNIGDWILNLVQDYYQVDGADLGERNSKWLQDDYVKFVRFAQCICSSSPSAILGFITGHGFIDNPTFRGMRQSLLTGFGELWVLDLHGNVKKKETTSDGGLDENVFDIQQGVAVFLAARGTKNALGLKQCDVFGTRSEKYAKLSAGSAKTISWRGVTPVSPFYVFLPQDEEVRAEYLRYPSIKQVMPVNVLGFQTHRDHFAVAFERETILSRCETLHDSQLKDAEIKARFEVSDNRDWNVRDARKAIRADAKWKRHVIRCLYRPFDVRWCYFSTVAMDYPRRELLDHVAEKENLCLLVPRQISFLPWQHTGVSDTVAESCLVSTKTKEQNYNFPLYLYPERDGFAFSSEKRPNFSEYFLRELAVLLKSPQVKPHGLPTGLTPEDIFHYAYAAFHSPNYRSRYAEFLKGDFPRLPLTGNVKLLRSLARLGGKLVAFHLLESPKLEKPPTKFVGTSREVKKVGFTDGTVWINAGGTGSQTSAGTSGFNGVPEEVWNFHIGGYQVCEKWLKDRKGRTLTDDDIAHYHKIVVALAETIRLMAEIDSVIDQHGGWPGAFSAVAIDAVTTPAESDDAPPGSFL